MKMWRWLIIYVRIRFILIIFPFSLISQTFLSLNFQVKLYSHQVGKWVPTNSIAVFHEEDKSSPQRPALLFVNPLPRAASLTVERKMTNWARSFMNCKFVGKFVFTHLFFGRSTVCQSFVCRMFHYACFYPYRYTPVIFFRLFIWSIFWRSEKYAR